MKGPTGVHSDNPSIDNVVEVVRRRCRVLVLLDAAERAGIAPMSSSRLHAFAYLADVLSPVWDLPAFDGKVLKSEGGPHYPDLQLEIDRLIILGLVEVSQLRYIDRPNEGARIEGDYGLRFTSPKLRPILAALGGEKHAVLDPADAEVYRFLGELAGAMATLPEDEIDVAVSVDATYADPNIAFHDLVDFGNWVLNARDSNPTVQAVERFETFLPSDVKLSRGEQLYLYASYLGRKAYA